MANKFMKICSPLLVMREIQIDIMMRYYYTSVRMAQKIIISPNTGEDAENLDHLYIVSGNVK